MATDDLQRLIVSLEAKTAKFEKAMNKALGVANSRTRQIESRFTAMNKRLEGSAVALGRQLAGAFAAQATISGARDLIDTATKIDNALKVAGLSGEELERVYGKLYESAKANAAPLETLVTLYGRAALVQKELGVTTEELLGFTNNVALALRVAGSDAQSASGALLQLSQALGSGVVRAEEFNSILEGAPTIAQAAAAGLKEAGGSVAKLRQLVVEGKVSSEALFRAFEAGSVILEQKVAGAALTTRQAFENLRTELVNAARKLDAVADVSGAAVDALGRLAGIVRGLSNVFEAAANGPIGAFIGKLETLAAVIAKIEPLSRSLGIVLNEDTLNGVADMLNPATGPTDVNVSGGKSGRLGVDPIQSRIDQAFGTGGGTKPVSLSDFAPPASRGSGGGGKSKKDSYQRELEQIKERTASLQAETAAQAQLNPLIEDYDYALTKAKATQDLLNAAQKAGIKITPELRANIDTLAEGYANATVEANKLAESQDRAREMADDMRSLGKDVLGGFIKDLQAGKSASEALANALGKVADKLLDIALDSLFGTGSFKGGGALGGLFSFIPKLFGFKDGGIAKNGKPLKTFARGGVSRSAAIFGETGQAEAAVPLPDGRRIPVDLRVPRVQAAQRDSAPSVTINAPINAPGADAAQLRRVEQSVQELGRNIPKIAVGAMKTTRTRNTRPA